jgi:hypothetical protein
VAGRLANATLKMASNDAILAGLLAILFFKGVIKKL